MALVPTDATVSTDDTAPTGDAKGVTPAFWTPSVAKSTEDDDSSVDVLSPPAAEAAPDVSPAESGTAQADTDLGPPPDSVPASEPGAPAGEPGAVGGAAPASESTDAVADSSADDTQTLRRPDDVEVPVFLDATGRRGRRLRALLWVVCLTGLTYATMLVLSLLGGHDRQSLGSPDFQPGQNPAPATGAAVASTQASIQRPARATPPESGTAPSTAATTSAASATPPPTPSNRTSAEPSASAPVENEPTPEAPPTPSASPSGMDAWLDTLFPWAA